MGKTFCEIAKGKPIRAVIGRSEFNSFLESFRSTEDLSFRRYRAKLDVVSAEEIPQSYRAMAGISDEPLDSKDVVELKEVYNPEKSWFSNNQGIYCVI